MLNFIEGGIFFGISRPFFTRINSGAYLYNIDENNVYN